MLSFFKKSLRHTIGKNFSWFAVEKILNTLVSFFVTAWIIRYLGPTPFGKLSYAAFFSSAFKPFQTLGTNQTTVRNLSQNPQDRSLLLGSMLFVRTLTSFITYVTCCFTAYYCIPDPHIRLLVYILGTTLLWDVFYVIELDYQAQNALKLPVIAKAAATGIACILKIIFILSHKNVMHFSVLLSFEGLLIGLFLWVSLHFKNESLFQWRISRCHIQSILKQARWMCVESFLAFLYLRSSVFLVQHFLGTTQNGLFSAGVKLVDSWQYVPMTLAMAAFPTLVEWKTQKTQSQFHQKLSQLTQIVFYSTLTYVLGVWLLAPVVIPLLLGPAFQASIEVAQIYASGLLFFCLGTLRNRLCIMEHQYDVLFFAALFGLLSNVFLGVYGMSHFGLKGAAWAAVASQAIAVLGVTLMFRQSRSIALLLLKAIVWPWKKNDA